jgi:hypothetical protein
MGAEDISSSLCVQTGSGAHPDSYPMDTKVRRFPSSGLLRCVLWLMFTNVSEVILPPSSGRRRQLDHNMVNLEGLKGVMLSEVNNGNISAFRTHFAYPSLTHDT